MQLRVFGSAAGDGRQDRNLVVGFDRRVHLCRFAVDPHFACGDQGCEMVAKLVAGSSNHFADRCAVDGDGTFA